MNELDCPHVNPDDSKCHGSVLYEAERISNGDGVWAESGWAFFLPEDNDGKVCCSEGHVLNAEQVAKLEKRAAEAYYDRR